MMKTKLTYRALALLLTAALLLTSVVSLSSMIASAEFAADITTQQSDTGGSSDTTTEPSTKPQSETTGQQTEENTDTTTQTETSAQPSTEPAQPSTTSPAVVSGGGKTQPPARPQVNAGGGTVAVPQAVTWLGVDGTTNNMGSASNPYAVSSLQHFLEIQDKINVSGNSNKYFRLTVDINLSTLTISNFIEYAGFAASLVCISPALAASYPTQVFFNLDGDGHRIYGLNVTNSGKDTTAIFGYVSANSVISNVAFEDCTLNVEYASAKVCAIVAVQNMGTIQGCSFKNLTLSMNSAQGDGSTSETYSFSGGHIVQVGYAAVAGDNQGTITDSYLVDTTVRVWLRRFVGAVSGQNKGQITNLNGSGIVNYGISGLTMTAVQSDGSWYIGGIAGKNHTGASITGCTVNLPGTGNVNSFTYGTYVGGVAGTNAGSITNCYIKGNLKNSETATASLYNFKGYGGSQSTAATFGGVAGINSGSIGDTSAENLGMFFQNTQNGVYGGIAGANSYTIYDCFASGVIDGYPVAAGYYLGGIVGSASTGTYVSNCYVLVKMSEYALTAGSVIGNGGQTTMFTGCYWSTNVSGWPTACALVGADDNMIKRSFGALNMVKSVSLPDDPTTTSITKSSFTHEWGAATVAVNAINTSSAFRKNAGDSNVFLSETPTTLYVTSGLNSGAVGKILYDLNIILPSGIGSSTQGLIAQQLSIDLVITSTAPANAVVSIDNPIVIQNAAEAELMKTVSYTNYKLGTDITMPGTWSPIIFSGTIDGNNCTLSVSKPVFSRIYGTRDDTVPLPGQPEKAANIAHGYIHDLTVYQTAATTTGVFGQIMSGTVKNVKLTGNASARFNAALTSNNETGAFINVCRGNTYLYGCFVDVPVYITNSNIGYIGGFIGSLSGDKAVIDNCGSNANVYCGNAAQSAIASFIGGISSGTPNTGIVKNCYVAGLVQMGGFIAIGQKTTSHKVQNLYWSIKSTNVGEQATVLPANNFGVGDSFYKWSFDETTGYVSETAGYINISLSPDVNVLNSAIPNNFSFVVADPAQIQINSVTRVNNKLTIEIGRVPGYSGTINTSVTIIYDAIGLRARLNIEQGLSKNSSGYYEIRNAGDLQYFTQNQNLYINEADLKVLLVNDIYMSGYTVTPLGTYNTVDPPSSVPFTGIFDGGGHTIHNMTLTGGFGLGLFQYAKNSTIKDIVFNSAAVTATQNYVAVLAAAASGCTISGISIQNSTVTSSYDVPGNTGYVGAVAGAFLAGADSTVSGILLDHVTVSVPYVGRVGGLVGQIFSTKVAISDVEAIALNVAGEDYVGGIAGQMMGASTIGGVQMSADSLGDSVISGTGYVGGVVGGAPDPNALNAMKITGCALSKIRVVNTGSILTETGATGGIAGWFSGTVGDDPGTAGTTEYCVVDSCYIEGMAVGGMVGRADTSTGNKNVTLSQCVVKGTTQIVATTAVGTEVAGGIFGSFANGTSTVTISYCYVRESVEILNGKSAGGILGDTTISTANINISQCQSFATITTGITSSYAGAIVGSEMSLANNSKISYCVAGGYISATNSTGGILGYHNSSTSYSLSEPNYHITECYVTAILNEASTYEGKIWGYNVLIGGFTALSNTTIANAIDKVRFSSYPQTAVKGFGRVAYNGYTNYKLCYDDVDMPDDNNPTWYQHSNTPTATIALTTLNPTATITINNLPSANPNLSGFVFDSGWVAANQAKIAVTASTATSVTVQALRSTTTDTAVVATYKNEAVQVYRTDTAEPITLEAHVPVSCTGIVYNWIGSGTQGDPWLIFTKYDLDEMRQHAICPDPVNEPNVYYFNGYYRIENNIVFDNADFIAGGDFYNTGKLFVPLRSTNPVTSATLYFTGNLDGNGKTITNLQIKNDTGVYTGLFEQVNGGEIKDLALNGATVTGNDTVCTDAGFFAAKADGSTFSGVSVADSVIVKSANTAGGIVGSGTACVITDASVSGCSVTVKSGGAAGGIAGAYDGSIGTTPTAPAAYDIEVTGTAVAGSRAGGVIGYCYDTDVDFSYCLVSGGSVVSAATEDYYAAGGILGMVAGTDRAFNIIGSKVDGTSVSAVRIAGGVIGKIDITSTSNPAVILVRVDNTESYAAVNASATSGVSAAGGTVGWLDDGRIVTLTDSVAGGTVYAGVSSGGVIGLISGLDTSYAMNLAVDNLVRNMVVSASPTGYTGAKVGLVLGSAAPVLFPQTTYTLGNFPFVNVKYSSYQYPSNAMIGDSTINTYTSPDFKQYIYNLNNDFSTGTLPAGYKSLRHFNGEEETFNIILGNTPLVLDSSNMLLPELPAYGVSGDFSDFTDTTGLNFTLKDITASKAGLVSYDPVNSTLTRVTGQGTAVLYFDYENGIRIALTILAYENLNGNGTEGSPYEILTIDHLELIRVFPSKYFKQVADLAFSAADFQPGGAFYNSGALWLPLQRTGNSVYFTGDYNGNGHTISGVQINRSTETYVGFFSRIDSGGRVYNLTLSNISVVGGVYVGAVAGYVTGNGTESTLDNVTVQNASISSPRTGVVVRVGGLTGREAASTYTPTVAGIQNSRVISASVTANATNASNTYTGGITAEGQWIKNCQAQSVTVNSGFYAGGIMAITDVPGGTNYPIKIEGCSLTGASTIQTTRATSISASGGMMAFINKRVQCVISSCTVDDQANIKSTRGTAGGIFGALQFPTGGNASLTLQITACQSYAAVTAYIESGAVIGTVRGDNAVLGNIKVEGCVAAGAIKSTGATNAVGGVIGKISCNSVASTTSSALIKDCVSSASLDDSGMSGSSMGKLVGNCTSIQPGGNGAIAEANYATVFDNNTISTYPQDTPPFASASMTNTLLTSYPLEYTDIMLCRQAGGPPYEFDYTFKAQPYFEGQPNGDYNIIAIATYDEQSPFTSYFRAQVHIWDGAAPAELAVNEPMPINAYLALEIRSVSTTTSALVGYYFDGTGSDRALYFSVNPTRKQSGYIELQLNYGLRLSLPLLTLDIVGNGLPANPFQIKSAEHLTLAYYLPSAYYKQMNDIAILDEDYQPGGILYNDDTPFQGLGFRPIGSAAYPFRGGYNGQGYKISGVRCNARNIDYVGFFGYVAGSAQLKNIHIELTRNTINVLGGIVGRNYVGGLAGYCATSAAVENCSVAIGNVSGRKYVGGLLGFSISSLTKCFTAVDVLAYGQTGAFPVWGEVGGLVGRVENASLTALTVSSCFALGSVYSGNRHSGGLIGTTHCQTSSPGLALSNCFFAGASKSGGTPSSTILIGAGAETLGVINATNVLVAGTNTNFNAALLPLAETVNTVSNFYFDVSMLGLTTLTQGTPLTTAQLTSGTLPAGFAAGTWTGVTGSYPRLVMADTYSNAYSTLAALPLSVSDRDYENGNTLADGIRFPVSIASTLPGSGADVTLTSSVVDATDTQPYPAGFDPDLTGNVGTRQTDLLFKAGTAANTIYRNIFNDTSYPAEGALIDLKVENYELWYSMRTPVLTVAATVNGVETSRRIKLPYEYSATTYYISTERQLRALNNPYESVGTKFAYLATAAGKYNAVVYLLDNINLRGNVYGSDPTVEFNPIVNFLGAFEGNGYTVKGLFIENISSDDIGMFKTLQGENSDYKATVRNLSLEDVWISGKNKVGAVAGSTNEYSLISNCKVYASGDPDVNASFVTGNETVGGLVGLTIGIVSNESRSAVPVSGNNIVGGLIGSSGASISNCFATGDVAAAITTTAPTVSGIGGLVGITTGGALLQAFASGDVTLTASVNVISPKSIGVGGLIGTLGSGTSITSCFSSGNVRAEDVKDLVLASAGTLTFGAGGLTGINRNPVTGCYSSSSVFARFNGTVEGAAGKVVAAGVGGISGVATNYISDAYSSGSVLREINVNPVQNNYTYFYDDSDPYNYTAIGGVIGTKAGSAAGGYTQLYYDQWNNSISGLTAIGGLTDTSLVRSLTTEQLCRSPKDPLLQLSGNMWSFNGGAYPSLNALVQPSVSPYILYPAVLSVVAVIPDERDTSARTGGGITMAITTPNSLTINGVTYDLNWIISDTSQVYILEQITGTTSAFVPIRTSNDSQILGLIVEITGAEQYGSRSFDRLCAQMLGTADKPYLISNKSDLQHIGPSSLPAAPGFEHFYNTWYSPITIEGANFNNYQGKVYFKLLSDIDMIVDVNITYNAVEDKLDVSVDNDGDGNTANDNHYIENLSPGGVPIEYKPGIVFSGISFAGNDYTIKNFTSAREFLFGISSVSDIRDIKFENLTINSVGTPNENLGTALVRYNQGTVDGCIINSASVTGGSKVAGLIAENQGVLTNCVINPDVTIAGLSNIGGITAVNGAAGQISNCVFAGDIVTSQAAGTAAQAGAFAAVNNGSIVNSISSGSVVSASGATQLGGFVGTNGATGVITGGVSRTTVTGGDIVGGFAAVNAGSITDAFSAGRVTATALNSAQTGIFCAQNSGDLNDAFADKALAGKSTATIFAGAVQTDDLITMTCGSLGSSFTKQALETAYPQLSALLDYSAYMSAHPEYEGFVPDKIVYIQGWSKLLSATLNTQYSQYVDTLALGSENYPLSIITDQYLNPEVIWTSSNTAVAPISAYSVQGLSAGSAVLTAAYDIRFSVDEVFPVQLQIPVTVGEQNPNFASGIGSASSPYEITTTNGFDSLSYYGPDSDIYYTLTADINYAGSCPQTPITRFDGHLAGNNHAVYDLTIENNSALFATLGAGSVISGIGIVGGVNEYASPDGCAALLAGVADNADIVNCYAVGDIEAATAIDPNYAGLLVAYAGPGTLISGCVTSGSVVNTSALAGSSTGGIAGFADAAVISDCLSTAYVRSAGGAAGGVVGTLANASSAQGCVFAGMALDAALASGASAPADPTGCIAGTILDTSAIAGSFYDKQMSLVGCPAAQSAYTAELAAALVAGWDTNAVSGNYAVPDGLDSGSTKFAAGLAFATMPVKPMLGSSAGSVLGYSKILVPSRSASDTVTLSEEPSGLHTTAYYLTITQGAYPADSTAKLSPLVDLLNVYTGLRITLGSGAGTVFENCANPITRYVEPRLARIVKVNYTLTNMSGNSGVETETVAIQIKNTQLFSDGLLSYSSDAFTTVSDSAITPVAFEDLVVGTGGFSAYGELPVGYAYKVTAQDQNGTYLLGGPGAPVMLETVEGIYTGYIALAEETEEVTIHYEIVAYQPWGVKRFWDSLVELFNV